jgi:hypothetical protein
MPNSIKYSTSAQTLALKKGNFWIGTGDVGKGPTSTTDYWNGITPPSGGYTIYLNKASGGPSIYTAANDSQLISLSNTIAGQTFATAAAALAWFATQTDKMVFDIDYPPIITNGLILNLDAGFTPSYPTTGTTWYDLISSENNGTLTNGPSFDSANNGTIVFDGTDDSVVIPFPTILNDCSFEVWFKATSTKVYQYLLSINNGTNSSYAFFLDMNDTDGGFAQTMWTYWNSGGTPYSVVPKTGTNGNFGDWNDSTWRHYVFTRSTTSAPYTLQYMNGNLVSNVSRSGDQTTQFGNGAGYNLYLGVYRQSFLPWAGNQSSVRIYNRALTAAEVLQNYNAQKGRYGL